MNWVDRPQHYKELNGILQLLQGSHLDNSPLIYLIIFFLSACHYFQYIFNVSSQFTVDTRSGLIGLSVVSLVVQETKTVLVPAHIHVQHMEDEGAAALGQV